MATGIRGWLVDQAIALGLKPSIRIDRIIGLGGFCEVAAQTRLLARAERAYPFDWWVTPLRSVPIILAHGADKVFEAHQLTKLPDYNGAQALYSHLGSSSEHGGTLHFHEFARIEGGFDLPIEEISRRLMDKYRFLHDRMLVDVRQGKTLFVRQFMKAHDPEGPEALGALVDALEAHLAKMSPDYLLLLVGYCALPPRPRVLQAECKVYDDVHDQGSTRGWREMFRTLGLRPRIIGKNTVLSDLKDTLPPEKIRTRRLLGFQWSRVTSQG